MHKPKKRYNCCYKKNHLKKKIYINIMYMGEMDQKIYKTKLIT